MPFGRGLSVAAQGALAGRWRILALLFTVRSAMAFQFQAVGALSPLYAQTYGVSLADIGLLIGLYMAPGAVFALPGGAMAARYGDRTLVLVGLALMLAGAALAWAAPSYAAQIAARLLAGVGGVILNVLMSKMVADWFAGREIATAMAIFVNSWPFGIAVALGVLPLAAATGGLGAALATVTGLTAAGLFMMLGLYRDPPGWAPPAQGARMTWPGRGAMGAVVIAALVWGLYNIALSMVFSFGPAMLTERGLALTQASALTSVTLWCVVVSIPLGGVLSDRLGRPDLVTALGCVGFAAGLVAAAAGASGVAIFALMGLAAGLPAGPIMALPSTCLPPAARAAGMGLFFSIYYGAMLLGPYAAGALAEIVADTGATFTLGAALLAACLALLALFRAVARPVGAL